MILSCPPAYNSAITVDKMRLGWEEKREEKNKSKEKIKIRRNMRKANTTTKKKTLKYR